MLKLFEEIKNTYSCKYLNASSLSLGLPYGFPSNETTVSAPMMMSGFIESPASRRSTSWTFKQAVATAYSPWSEKLEGLRSSSYVDGIVSKLSP